MNNESGSSAPSKAEKDQPWIINRRGALGFLARCLFIAAFPMTILPDSPAEASGAPASEEVLAEPDCWRDASVVWTVYLDSELHRRWLAADGTKEIATALGVPVKMVRSRAARHFLPPRRRQSTES